MDPGICRPFDLPRLAQRQVLCWRSPDVEVLATVRAILAQSITLSQGDFGTGYFSPCLMHRLHVQELKQSRSFALGIED